MAMDINNINLNSVKSVLLRWEKNAFRQHDYSGINTSTLKSCSVFEVLSVLLSSLMNLSTLRECIRQSA